MNHNPVYVKPKTRFVGMEIAKTGLSILILAGSLVGAWLLGLLKEKPAETTAEQLVPQVRVVSVSRFSGKLDLSVRGTVVPFREVRIAAEVGGRISRRSELCRAGSLVRAGDLLVEIDRENYDLALKTAEAEVLQAEVMLAETHKEIEGLRENVRLSDEQEKILQKDFDRYLKLKDVVSPSELDQSRRSLLELQNQHSTRENNLMTAEARLERLQAAIDLSKRRCDRAKLDLERTSIRAPFDGVVVRSMVEQDDFVQGGTVLLIVEDTSRVEVICNLVETELNWLRQNAPATVPGVTSDEGGLRAAYRLPQVPVLVHDSRYPDVTWEGRLDRFDGIGRDEMTKAIPVRVVVDQPLRETDSGPRALVRGMFVECRLVVEPDPDASADQLLAVPSVAVRPGGMVWTVKDGKLQSHRIEAVTSVASTDSADDRLPGLNQRLIVVKHEEGGLQPGDEVVVSPLSQPMDGVTVRLEPAALSTEGAPVVKEPALPDGTGKLPAEEAKVPDRESKTPVRS